MQTVLYTPGTIPTATTYQTIRVTGLVNAIQARLAEWAAVDPTLSTKIPVSAMFEELESILADLGVTENINTRNH